MLDIVLGLSDPLFLEKKCDQFWQTRDDKEEHIKWNTERKKKLKLEERIMNETEKKCVEWMKRKMLRKKEEKKNEWKEKKDCVWR